MRSASSEPDIVDPDCLGAGAAFEWRQLSAHVLAARRSRSACNTNVTLQAAIDREPESPAAAAFALWIGDNLAKSGHAKEALKQYDVAVRAFGDLPPLYQNIDGLGGTLLNQAQCARLSGDHKTAIEAYTALARHDRGNADPMFQAGLVMEAQGKFDQAAKCFSKVAAKTPSGKTHDPAQLARRALLRQKSPDSAFAPSAEALAYELGDAVTGGDTTRVRALVSETHFGVGPIGGHITFEEPELLERLCEDLSASSISLAGGLTGLGAKRYLSTEGWRGRWFRGNVTFLLVRSAKGWQCHGCALGAPNELWIEHWRPAVPQTNQPLPFELLAPWPDGLCCEAGGLSRYIVEQATVLAALALPWPLGPAVAAGLSVGFSARSCGFGPRGFYYNGSSTHDEEDAFAIDFTRYQRWVPYINRSEGTPVLAPRNGVVSSVAAGTPSGSDTASNTVEIHHGDPNDPSNTDRYTSCYLHLQGPNRIPVSQFMPVFTGNRLGLMDDTGNSAISHLHFSIHDRQILYPGVPKGGSVRPTPMNGVTLQDGDSGKCVCSTNVETIGAPEMIFPNGFAAQNWVFTPVANAVGEAPERNIRNQRWQLLLSGVVLVDLKGESGASWRRETLRIMPDMSGPAQQISSRYGLPLPPGVMGQDYFAAFQVEQIAPFATIGSIFNQNQSVNSGFAVDVSRPHPFFSAQDVVSGTVRNNLFDGIQADLAVRDSDAFLHRVGYRITLVGRLVFCPIVIE